MSRSRHDRRATPPSAVRSTDVAASIASGQASAAGEGATNLGYPEDSTLFYPVLLYNWGFRYFQMGYASAMAMLLLVVSFAVTLVIVLNSRKWVHQAVPR